MPKELSDLEKDIEATRDRLADTIDQLAHRAHPKTIASREVESIKGFFVDAGTGEPRTTNILKVVGVVAGIAGAFVLLRKLSH